MLSIQALKLLRENGVDTVEKLAILVAAKEPILTADLSERASVSLRTVQRFVKSSNGLLVRVTYSEERFGIPGRPPIMAIVRTEKANQLLKRFYNERRYKKTA